MIGFLFNAFFCGLAVCTAKVYLRDRDYIRFGATVFFACILATCGIMAIR